MSDRYEQAGAAERAGFEALLERSDPELEDLLTGRLAPESPQQARVIERIRRHD